MLHQNYLLVVLGITAPSMTLLLSIVASRLLLLGQDAIIDTYQLAVESLLSSTAGIDEVELIVMSIKVH